MRVSEIWKQAKFEREGLNFQIMKYIDSEREAEYQVKEKYVRIE